MAAYDALLTLEGVKGESRCQAIYPSLTLLVADLRRHSKGYVLTSVSHGPHDASMQHLLQALGRLGVPQVPRSGTSVLDTIGLGLVELQPRNAGAAQPGPARALLMANPVAMLWPLLPAVQKVRASVVLMRPQVAYTLFAGGGRAAGGKGDDHGDWILLDTMPPP